LGQLPSTLPGREEGRGGLTPAQVTLRHMEDVLVGCGLDQVITYSFGEPGWADKLRLTGEDVRRQTVRLSNPLSIEQSVMRTLLLPGLLSAAARNLAQRNTRVHIFEIGKVFVPGDQDLPGEPRRLGMLLMGEWEDETWTRTNVPTDYYLGKGIIERLVDALGIDVSFERCHEPFLHPGKSARLLVDTTEAGWLGEVHPLVLQTYDLPLGCVACELDADALLRAASEIRMFEDLMTYPGVEEDLALIVDADMSAAAVEATVRELGGPLLQDVRIFDVYQGAQLGEGKISLALRVMYRSPERTLNETEVGELRAGLLAGLQQRLGVQLRA
ncbi:MAG: phenylalanine--tRNA ligase subunit beta, partial [Actinobacteria bacterium]|nr:phenylalanine--tRNA ligase subunit beta [Actinomycetota bacterium]